MHIRITYIDLITFLYRITYSLRGDFNLLLAVVYFLVTCHSLHPLAPFSDLKYM
jgi:hypothetical protein